MFVARSFIRCNFSQLANSNCTLAKKYSVYIYIYIHVFSLRTKIESCLRQTKMSKEKEEEPASPTARLMQTPGFDLCIYAVMGYMTVIDLILFKKEIEQTLARHPRFSSLLVSIYILTCSQFLFHNICRSGFFFHKILPFVILIHICKYS